MLGDSVAGQLLGVGKKLLGLGLLMPLGKGQGDTGLHCCCCGWVRPPTDIPAGDQGPELLGDLLPRPQSQQVRLSARTWIVVGAGTSYRASVGFPLSWTLARESRLFLDLVFFLFLFSCLCLLVIPGCKPLLGSVQSIWEIKRKPRKLKKLFLKS